MMRRQKYLFVVLLIFIPQIVVFISLNEVSDDSEPDVLVDGQRRQALWAAEDPEQLAGFGKSHRDDLGERLHLRTEEGGDVIGNDKGAKPGRRRLSQKRSMELSSQPESQTRSLHVKRIEHSKAEQIKVERRWLAELQNMTDRLFLPEMGPKSDSVCRLPNLKAPSDMCPDQIGWECNMVPAFSTYDPSTSCFSPRLYAAAAAAIQKSGQTRNRNITVNCLGRFRVNQVDRTESEEVVARGSYRRPAVWKYYQGPQEIPMETEYADIVCKNKKMQDLHNYHTQFVPKPAADREQEQILQKVKGREPLWKPVSVLTIALDSTSRAQAHRRCGLPKTMALLKKFYTGYFNDIPAAGKDSLSHQSFFFNRFNSISGSTVLNLTPLFSGQLYQDDVDMGKVAKGIYAKDIKEWQWEYAAQRGYITSYGVDNNSGMMGTRTHCKACHYRPPVLPHVEHGWQKRENKQVRSNVLSGLCDGNHMLHEHILNYTRDFLRHPYPAKWAGLDLNAGHRRETESGNQVDAELASFLEEVLRENNDLVVFILGDHGKPLHKDPSHLGSYYETLLPFLSIVMPTWLLRNQPDIMANLINNQQRYMVHADLHLSMKSLLHYPYMTKVGGAVASKAINVFTETIPRWRSCEQANIPPWTCVCGYMQKLAESDWTSRHTSMVHRTLSYINAMHGRKKLISAQHQTQTVSSISQTLAPVATSCMDLRLRRILNVLVNENTEEEPGSARRYVYHVTFQTVEEDTVWSVVMYSDMTIKQVKQITLYQPYDVCWDRRVPLQFCVCDKSAAPQPSPSRSYEQPVR